VESKKTLPPKDEKGPSGPFILCFLLATFMIVVGAVLVHRGADNIAMTSVGAALLGAGVLAIAVFLIAIPVTQRLGYIERALLKQHQEMTAALGDRLQGISVMMNLISEQQLISDRAKSVAYREKDREAVERAVQEEVLRQNWEGAIALATDIATGFGLVQESNKLKEEIIAKRNAVHDQQFAELMGPIDRHVQAEAWGAAMEEAQAVMDQFPEDERAKRLPQEIENRRQGRKQQLKDSWQQAVNRHDVDGSIEILRRLDLYLTPVEADSMQEIARNVFKEKREVLRLQFTQCVQERRWLDAIRIGDEIINDFPNTRIAQEVRETMPTLRARSMEPAETSA
jgi:hypothetical protein